MKNKQLTVSFCLFAYGGNGTMQAMPPMLSNWIRDTHVKAINDPRIEIVHHVLYTDTPITMTRNRAVMEARKAGVDVLLMLDNDNVPDIEVDGKPFWDTSFDFLWNHYDKGPVLVMAPYCGAPPIECPMIFEWHDYQCDEQNDVFKLQMITRHEAARRSGIMPTAAGPTGVSMWDMRLFDLVPKPYFAYEWTDEDCSEKASTEDVYATRNISLAGIQKLGYNPVFVNCDAWAGHIKPKMVGKPRLLTADRVHESLVRAVKQGRTENEKSIIVTPPEKPLHQCDELAARAQILNDRARSDFVAMELQYARNGHS